jgi:chloramphenicol O-acetyltransferase type A
VKLTASPKNDVLVEMTKTEFHDEAEQIDLGNWERAALYELFRSFPEPFHSVCLRLDCTETFRFAKDSHLSVFLTLLHRSLIAAQQVENFKIRIVNGVVWRYHTIHGGSAVGRSNGTIGFGHYSYEPETVPFVKEASLVVERVKGRLDLERFPGQNLIRYSVLPWFDFTSISHAMNSPALDSAPKITFGKITEANGRCTLPVSIHVHHALADGLHVAQFVEQFQKYLSAPEMI